MAVKSLRKGLNRETRARHRGADLADPAGVNTGVMVGVKPRAGARAGPRV